MWTFEMAQVSELGSGGGRRGQLNEANILCRLNALKVLTADAEVAAAGKERNVPGIDLVVIHSVKYATGGDTAMRHLSMGHFRNPSSRPAQVTASNAAALVILDLPMHRRTL